MLDENGSPAIAARVRVLQVIVFSLATGVLVFTAIVLFGHRQGPQQPGSMLTLMSVCLGVVNSMLAVFVPRIIVSGQRRRLLVEEAKPSETGSKGDVEEKLIALYQTKTVLGAALLEGAAFFALVAHMLEHQIASLAVALLMLAGILMHFPTYGRVQTWMDAQRRELADERLLP